jgi:hypothetical protein
MSFDTNILVNGSRCKIYEHNGRKFIEAKEGSEYAVEFKNNSWEKILAVVSVDGLNIVDGEPATENGPGYVVDRYCSQKFLGFQYSNENVATFKFGSLGTGYASSKKDGSDKNAGIIGIRVWNEKPSPPAHSFPNVLHHEHFNPSIPSPIDGPNFPYGITGSTLPNFGLCGTDSNNLRGGLMMGVNEVYNCYTSAILTDMETQWGESKTYKVKETTFERQSIIYGTDIYYASRESLIAMGVNLGNEKRVSFPQSFPNKYAKPPSGWKG